MWQQKGNLQNWDISNNENFQIKAGKELILASGGIEKMLTTS